METPTSSQETLLESSADSLHASDSKPKSRRSTATTLIASTSGTANDFFRCTSTESFGPGAAASLCFTDITHAHTASFSSHTDPDDDSAAANRRAALFVLVSALGDHTPCSHSTPHRPYSPATPLRSPPPSSPRTRSLGKHSGLAHVAR